MGFWEGVLQNTLGGLGAGAVAYGMGKQFLSVPDLSGAWTISAKCDASALRTYIGVEVEYIALLWQRGADTHGTAEKVFERRRDKTTLEYVGEKRNLVEINGGLKGFALLGSNEFLLHAKEVGRRRTFSTLYTIEKKTPDLYEGTFFSTAANSSGTCRVVRGVATYKFSQ